MPEAESWIPIAQTLGFESELEMLKHLYVQQDFSLSQMSSIIGYSTWTIRRRLLISGIPLKGRGGPNNREGRRRLKHVSDDDLCKYSAVDLAKQHQVHVSTVWAEIRFRKQEKKDAILSDHANMRIREVRELERPLDGSSSVSPHRGVPEVLPGEGGEG